MGWSRPIPFYKSATATATSQLLLHPLGATQRIRIINMWGAVAGKPAEITLRYLISEENTIRYMKVAHGIVSELVFNGNSHLEVWAEAFQVLFETDDLQETGFTFGGEYKVKR